MCCYGFGQTDGLLLGFFCLEPGLAAGCAAVLFRASNTMTSTLSSGMMPAFVRTNA